MSVVGIDFGSYKSVIAVARNRGIDVIINEVSNRATPSLVGFGPKSRYLGETAKNQEMSNFKNTIGNIQRVPGRSPSDSELVQVEQSYINIPIQNHENQPAFKVNYQNEEQVFTGTQVAAMYLTQLKHTAERELGSHVTDIVISVPGFFTDSQRRALLDASEIAGLNCLRLMNNYTAMALSWGITKTDLPEDKARVVVFVDIGYAATTVAVVYFIKGKLTIKSVAFNRQLGGRNVDEVLVDHFAKEFKEKYKIDVKSNNKALLRLRAGCERLKKVLSANSNTTINVEAIMNDIDVKGNLSRSELETMIQPLLDQIEGPCAEALAAAGISKEQVDAVEVVGGSVRIPAIKERLTKFFGMEVSTTLNSDEAAAKGCALQCAILSPAFKVREYHIHDVTPYAINFSWDSSLDAEKGESQLEVFQPFNTIPSTKLLTFYRKENFDLELKYANTDAIPKGSNPWISRFTVKGVKPNSDGSPATIKVKARINLHGVVSVESAQLLEDVEPKKSNGTSMEVDDGEKPEEKDEKRKVRKIDLTIIPGTTSLPKEKVLQLRELENSMIASDKLVADTEISKNALEEYMYEIRNKIDGVYGPFIEEADATAIKNKIDEIQNWLYEEGEESTKSVYNGKLSELQKLGNPVAERYRESEERPVAAKALLESINLLRNFATGNEEQYSHIDAADKEKVLAEAKNKEAWLNEQLAKQEQNSKTAPVVVLASAIVAAREQLVAFAKPIVSKPKPAPVVPEPNPEVKPETAPAANDIPKAEDDGQGKTDMDLD